MSQILLGISSHNEEKLSYIPLEITLSMLDILSGKMPEEIFTSIMPSSIPWVKCQKKVLHQ